MTSRIREGTEGIAVTYLVSAADRAAFKRCRRQWDFTATTRRHLHPLADANYDLDRAIRDALAVYYFPGMWDWDSTIVLPLVIQALDDALTGQRNAIAGAQPPGEDAVWQATVERGHSLLKRYLAWAPSVDHFSPVRVETDFDAIVPDPADPECGLFGPDGGEFRYTGRIDLLAMDDHDRYWVVRHRVIDDLPPTEHLLLDEESVAACWAWERFYDGMEVAGTIYNELSLASSGADPSAPPTLADHPRGGIPQNEPSGGGRGVSSTRRMYVKGRADETTERLRQSDGDGFRRTVIRRNPAEVQAVGVRLGQEALDMIGAEVRTYPSPAPEHCSTCAFISPCLAIEEGADVEPILAAHYREQPAVKVEMGRLAGPPMAWAAAGGLGRADRARSDSRPRRRCSSLRENVGWAGPHVTFPRKTLDGWDSAVRNDEFRFVRRSIPAVSVVELASTVRKDRRAMLQKIVPNLWFDTEAEEAANFYTSVFKNSRIVTVTHYTDAGPRPAGTVMTVEFELDGHRFVGINGGPDFTFSEAVSFQIDCADQDEIDYYWGRLTDGGEEGPCGWLKDKYGLSWQVVPTGIEELLTDDDPQRAARAMQAMFGMKKLDVAALRSAADGVSVS